MKVEVTYRVPALEQALRSIIALKPSGAAEHLTPCLIGPTGAGKTSRAQSLARGLPMVRLLLGTMMAEDVLGLPRVRGGRTIWALPEWFDSEKPICLFLDELDKAKPEVLSTVLTLLAERRIRQHTLHPASIVIAAMQPVDPAVWLADETGRALSARLVFLPVQYDWQWLEGQLGINLAGLPNQEIRLPVLPFPSTRQVSWLVQWDRANYKKIPADVRDLVWYGVLTKEWADELRGRLDSSVPMSPEDVVRTLNEDPSRVSKLSVGELVALSADTLHHGTPAVWEEAIVKVWTEGTQDEAEAYLSSAYNELVSRIGTQGELEIAAGHPEEEVAAALNRAAVRIAKVWKARRDKKE